VKRSALGNTLRDIAIEAKVLGRKVLVSLLVSLFILGCHLKVQPKISPQIEMTEHQKTMLKVLLVKIKHPEWMMKELMLEIEYQKYLTSLE